ncbi:Uncharacterised protein [Yersinia aldovae]|uniref:Uncharacterized protein n=1 Tax=Yersinia aldovae TaxID=29483 RepID=A0A0T9UPX3_YERAL|nr:Uncharacterised protein [Yersinia aldovae]CNL44803.1 Uncharacterised protein [Yersinia aldovae]CNL59860.1 Uncharacterised protein [Yersinia aldovae]
MCEKPNKREGYPGGWPFFCVSDSDDSIIACDKLRMQFEPRLTLAPLGVRLIHK